MKNFFGLTMSAILMAFVCLQSATASDWPKLKVVTGASIELLDIGTLVVLSESMVSGDVYFPKDSTLRVLDVISNRSDWKPGAYQVDEIPTGFQAKVLLGADRAESKAPLLTLNCEMALLSAQYSSTLNRRFVCDREVETFNKKVRVYRGE